MSDWSADYEVEVRGRQLAGRDRRARLRIDDGTITLSGAADESIPARNANVRLAYGTMYIRGASAKYKLTFTGTGHTFDFGAAALAFSTVPTGSAGQTLAMWDSRFSGFEGSGCATAIVELTQAGARVRLSAWMCTKQWIGLIVGGYFVVAALLMCELACVAGLGDSTRIVRERSGNAAAIGYAIIAGAITCIAVFGFAFAQWTGIMLGYIIRGFRAPLLIFDGIWYANHGYSVLLTFKRMWLEQIVVLAGAAGLVWAGSDHGRRVLAIACWAGAALVVVGLGIRVGLRDPAIIGDKTPLRLVIGAVAVSFVSMFAVAFPLWHALA